MKPCPPERSAVLVVDDCPDSLQLLACLLQKFGYSPRLALSGELALAAARRSPPELILLDVNMPQQNGYQVCQCLKQEEALQNIPVIFLSGNDEVENKVRGFQAGAVDYITKPFEEAEVRMRIHTHLEMHRLQTAARHHAAELAATVRERTRELAASNVRLAQLDGAKSEFLTVISHELRTPLNGLLGTTEMLLLEMPDSPAKTEYLHLHENARKRIMELIEDAQLLAALRVRQSAFDGQTCRLDAVLPEAFTAARTLAQALDIHLPPPAPIPAAELQGEPRLLTRALQCLLETACKFAPPGQPVLTAVMADNHSTTLRLQIPGPPLAPEFLARFFDVLAIGKTLTHGGDLGLSPAVAAQIIQVCNGGTVAITNHGTGELRIEATLIHPEALPSGPPHA